MSAPRQQRRFEAAIWSGSAMRNLTTSTSARRNATWLATALLAFAALVLTPASAAAQTEVVEYYATDAVGSTRVVFDANGVVKAQSDYLPFGEALSTTGNLPAQRFTGQERDGEAGLDNFNARALSVRTGRFGRLDPAGGVPTSPQSWNRYAYVSNNPLSFTDPTGMYNTPSTMCSQATGAYWCPGNTGPSNVDDYFNPDKYGYHGGEMDGAEADYGAAVDAVFMSNYEVGREQALSRAQEQQTGSTITWTEDFREKDSTSDWNVVTLAGGVADGAGPLANLFEAVANALLTSLDCRPGVICATVPSSLLVAPEAPGFIAAEDGMLFPVPRGATGPYPPRAPGMLFEGGSGGYGLDSRVTGVRIMDANKNQGARAVYMNAAGQRVNPFTGRTVGPSDPWAHIYFNPKP